MTLNFLALEDLRPLHIIWNLKCRIALLCPAVLNHVVLLNKATIFVKNLYIEIQLSTSCSHV